MLPVSYTHLDVYKRQHRPYEESVQGVLQVHMRDFPPGLDLGQTNLKRVDLLSLIHI